MDKIRRVRRAGLSDDARSMGHRDLPVEGRLKFSCLICQPLDDRELLADACGCLNSCGFLHRRLAELQEQIRRGFMQVACEPAL